MNALGFNSSRTPATLPGGPVVAAAGGSPVPAGGSPVHSCANGPSLFSPIMPSTDGSGTLVGLGSIWQNAVTLDNLAIMHKHYEEPYPHATRELDLDSIPAHADWVFIGAREAGATDVALGAFAKRDEVLRPTKQNAPHKHNDVWWYRTENYSFGFSPVPEVAQHRADTAAPKDERRLSWHLQGDGGWRAGAATDLNTPTPWRKLIFYGIDPDRFTPAEVGAVDLYMGPPSEPGISDAPAPFHTAKVAPSDKGPAARQVRAASASGQRGRRGRNLQEHAQLAWQKTVSLTGLAVTVESIRTALGHRKESPKYGLLKAVTGTLQSAPQWMLALFIVAREGYGQLREHQLVVVASGLVSLVYTSFALVSLLTSSATAPGLRVRDEYICSSHVAALITAYFLADAVLRGLALAVLGYSIGDAYLLMGVAYLGALVVGGELFRVLCRAGCGALCGVLVSMQRAIEVSVRALIPLLAPPVLQPCTPAERRWGFIVSTGLTIAMVVVGLSEDGWVPRPPDDVEVRTLIVSTLCACVTIKYLAFVTCVFPAMHEDSYGVVGVLAHTRAAGRAVFAEAATPAKAANPGLPMPIWLPPPSVTGNSGYARKTLRVVAAVPHAVLVVLTCGLCGRKADGTYFGDSHEVAYVKLGDEPESRAHDSKAEGNDMLSA